MKNNDDDHPILPIIIKVKLLNYALSFIEQN